MLGNYLAAALRNLTRNRLYAAINIVGLAVGFAAALLIALYVRDELTFDHYFADHEQLYLLALKDQFPGRPPTEIDFNSGEYAAKLRQEYPDLSGVTRLQPGRVSFRVGDAESSETILWADPTLFGVLKFRPAAGDLDRALAQPDGIVLTRALARKYFGKDEALGQFIDLRNESESRPFLVTAIIEDLPYNVHLGGGALVAGHGPLSPLAKLDANPPPPGTFQITTLTYLKIADAAAGQRIADDLPAFLKRHKQPSPNGKMELLLKPLDSLHFSAGTGMKPRGTFDALLAIAAIGALIVFVASVNFVNLMTARAARRATEVGVRKATGADRRHLIVQFVGEAIIYVFISVGLGLGLAAILLPTANAFLDRTLHLDFFANPASAAFVVALGIFVGVLAGLYPAFVLASFRPASVLKAGSPQGHASAFVRQSLVVLQFAFLIGLLIAAGVVDRQIRFALTEAQRLDADEVLLVHQNCRQPFKDAVAALPGVRATTCSTGAGIAQGFRVGQVIKPPERQPIAVQTDIVDPGFFEFYGLKPVAGRFFDARTSDAAPADRNAPMHAPIVINEAAARKFSFASVEAAVGQSLTLLGPGGAEPSEIIGVVPDFAADAVRNPIQPALYYVDPLGYTTTGPQGQAFEIGMISIRLDGAGTPETLKDIDRLWKEIVPTRPINRVFLKQSIEARFADIRRVGTLFAASASIAVFIALLGLFGLSSFTTERRTKEIGVRKAMGAASGDILRLLLWQFAQPVLWANLLAWPIAFWAMNRWLQGFAARIELAPWMFLASGAIALAVAILTVSAHCLLVARTRPVLALRHE